MVRVEPQVVQVIIGGIARRLLDDRHLIVFSSIDGFVHAQNGGTEHTAHRMAPPCGQAGADLGVIVDGVGGLEPRQPLLVSPFIGIGGRVIRAL